VSTTMNCVGSRAVPPPAPCSTTSRSIGLRVPLKFNGRAVIGIGRKAEPGEPYATTSSADITHCLGGMTVAQMKKRWNGK
jgi:hypothetical protein